MKFILVICLSLIVTLFHVATMPIHVIGDPSMAAHSEMSDQHSMHQHHKMMQAEHHQSDDNCPHYSGTCCLTLTIPFNSLQSIQLSASADIYPSPSLSIPKTILNKLYRPPKLIV